MPAPPLLFRRILFATSVIVLLTAERQRPVRIPVPDPPRDEYSFSEPQKILVTHLDLDLSVDFTARVLRGSATLALLNRTGTTELVLDIRQLHVREVTADGRPTTWSAGSGSIHGQPLTVRIKPDTKSVTIAYETLPSPIAFTWATAAQSYGRQTPYLYSQNEPVGARSWIPVQDTPSVRMTYDATIRVPSGMLALMSAENPRAVRPDGVYTFHMDESVPAYLIALAAGRLEFLALDDRTGVYAEPELIGEAGAELSFVPEMVNAAERVIAPYPWRRYDILLMPPIYQFGGMEHPRLNFLNPFPLVSGNGTAGLLPSSLVAHELAHSWGGDETTLATWSDTWLNEGFASYLALRILEEMSGAERSQHTLFLDRMSYEQYLASPANVSKSILHRTFGDPNSAFDATSYVKGELFLQTLEDRLGRRAFDRFLGMYFSRLRFRWVDDRTFLQILGETAPEATALALDQWIYETGLPDNVTAPQSSAIFDRVSSQLSSFRGGTAAGSLDTGSWTAVEFNLFLQLGLSDVERRMSEVDAAFGLSLRNTPPYYWLHAVAQTTYQPGLPALRRALERGGPNSWITNLYTALADTARGRSFALSVYPALRERYDVSVRRAVDLVLNYSAKNAA